MSLAWKLFISYVIVVMIALLVLALLTAYTAPTNFSISLDRSNMMMNWQNGGWGQGHGRGMGSGGMMMEAQEAAVNDQLDRELNQVVRESVNQALLRAGMVAVLAALGASWLVSRRITQPIRSVVKASHTIADGHYNQRLPVTSGDELGELTASFNQMAAALARTETIRQQLMGDVTHELKTPLASIKGYMEGLQDGVIPASLETFQVIHREADRLGRLVQDLNELSRMEALPTDMQIERCDARDLMQTAIQRLQPQFDDKAVGLHLDLPADPLFVQADADRSVQILINLLGNALQYTPSGGRVSLSASPHGSMVQIAVKDTGIGLAADDLKQIFQRFYRVDKSRARSSGGSGIGLTIARYLVEAQGGRIWAESAGADQGSTFRFTLPAA